MNYDFYCQNCGEPYNALWNISGHNNKCYKCKVVLKVYRSWYVNIIVWLHKKFVFEKEYDEIQNSNAKTN